MRHRPFPMIAIGLVLFFSLKSLGADVPFSPFLYGDSLSPLDITHPWVKDFTTVFYSQVKGVRFVFKQNFQEAWSQVLPQNAMRWPMDTTLPPSLCTQAAGSSCWVVVFVNKGSTFLEKSSAHGEGILEKVDFMSTENGQTKRILWARSTHDPFYTKLPKQVFEQVIKHYQNAYGNPVFSDFYASDANLKRLSLSPALSREQFQLIKERLFISIPLKPVQVNPTSVEYVFSSSKPLSFFVASGQSLLKPATVSLKNQILFIEP